MDVLRKANVETVSAGRIGIPQGLISLALDVRFIGPLPD